MNSISVNNAPKTFRPALYQMHDVRPSTIAAHHEAVERVIRMMRDRLDEPLTLQEMSKTAYISPCHFNRTFRQITGIPPKHQRDGCLFRCWIQQPRDFHSAFHRFGRALTESLPISGTTRKRKFVCANSRPV